MRLAAHADRDASLRMMWNAFCVGSTTQRVIVSRAWTEALVQTTDYYPYGGTRISVATSTNEKRKFIGQFRDDSGLDYLNARYYSSDRGQFISQDPMFWLMPKSLLEDPQQLNSYNYGRNNPITRSDPTGLLTFVIPGTGYSEKDWSSTGAASGFIA